jgi:hypothetical protein
MFAVARDLRMTVRELGTRMDSAEFSEWIAYNRYYSALPDSWRETALIVTALLAPHIGKNQKRPKPEDFNPIEHPPQHESQDFSAIMELRKAFGLGDLKLEDDV